MGIGQWTALLDVEIGKELFSHQMGGNTCIGADTDIGVRRTEEHRLELGMAIGEMQQRDLALGIKT